MTAWRLQEAEARFAEMLDEASLHGPQLITRRGVETAVVVPIEVWRDMEAARRPALKDVLLAHSPTIAGEWLDPDVRRIGFVPRPVSFE